MVELYDFQDYKKYLAKIIESQPKKGWGFRAELSAAMDCQATYLSRVLSNKAEISLEQAEKLSIFLKHRDEETEYLLLLVQAARAGTQSLRRRFEDRIRERLEQRFNLSQRFQIKEALSNEDKTTYYSNWYYAAIHVLTSIPAYQKKEAIAARLSLSVGKVSEILSFLLSVGLVVEKKGAFKIGTSRIHLGKTSPLLNRHLSSWRIQSLRALEKSSAEDFFYSGVVSISRTDQIKLKSMLITFIEECNKVVHSSKEEDISVFSVDFFSF